MLVLLLRDDCPNEGAKQFYLSSLAGDPYSLETNFVGYIKNCTTLGTYIKGDKCELCDFGLW